MYRVITRVYIIHVIRPQFILLIIFQVCESIAGLENDIPAAMMARLLKYVVLKRRLQDLVDAEDMTKVSCSYI